MDGGSLVVHVRPEPPTRETALRPASLRAHLELGLLVTGGAGARRKVGVLLDRLHEAEAGQVDDGHVRAVAPVRDGDVLEHGLDVVAWGSAGARGAACGQVTLLADEAGQSCAAGSGKVE